MVIPFSTVITALLKGNVLGFGYPGAKEMSDFVALAITSAVVRMGEGRLAALVAVMNRA